MQHRYNKPVFRQPPYRILMGALLLIGAALLGWGLWPLPQVRHEVLLSAAELSLPEQGLSLGECRVQTITWPRWMRLGDPAIVQLEVGTADRAECRSQAAAAFTGALALTAELQGNGMAILPGGQLSQALTPGQPVRLSWRVQVNRAGEYGGALWLHLHPSITDQASVRRLLSAFRFSAQVVSLAGLSGRAARILGSVMVVIGLVWLVGDLWLGNRPPFD